MSVRIADGTVRLEGNVPVEEAETILAALQDQPQAIVDLGQAVRLHSAVVQLLLAARPQIIGRPADPFVLAFILPILDANR